MIQPEERFAAFVNRFSYVFDINVTDNLIEKKVRKENKRAIFIFLHSDMHIHIPFDRTDLSLDSTIEKSRVSTIRLRLSEILPRRISSS